jgi:PAS domain S-box-containing protein
VENQKEKILLVEDDRVDRLAFERHVETYGFPYEFIMAASVKEAKSALKSEKLDAAVIDYWLGDGTAFDLFSDIQDMPIVVVTGTGDEEIAVKAMKTGASDYVIKDPESNYLKALSETIGNAIRNKRVEKKLKKYREYLEELVTERTAKLKQEIAERVSAEEALKDQCGFLQTLIDAIPIPVFFKDRQGIYQGCNNAYAEFLGLEKEEIVGKGVRDIFPKEMGDVYSEADEVLFTNPGSQFYEAKMDHADGTCRDVFFNKATFMNKNGKIGGLIGAMIDITKRRQAEEERNKLQVQLQRAQTMEAIGTLAGGIAHDFNNIIGVIMGCAELSMSDTPEKSPIYQHLKQIFSAGKRAADLVQQILMFSRQKDPEKKALQISTIIKEILKMLRASLPATIEIKQNIAPDIGMVLADPTQINQVLMNLCTNAAHAMRKNGGVLEIMLGNVDLTFDDVKKYVDIKPGAYVKLTVSDTGTGMDHRIIERIFDPYFTTKKSGEGTGLGLAVVHGIISQYGGGIEVQSEPDMGATFHILIPRIDHKHDVTPEKDFGELPKGSETILFVDDEKGLVEITKKMLESLGYQVIADTSSIEALKLFMEEPNRFDLVITDMTMPHMTGEKLSGEILRIRPDIPIILCTGFSEMISEDKAKFLGIREFLLKPVGFEILARNVRKVLGHRIDD